MKAEFVKEIEECIGLLTQARTVLGEDSNFHLITLADMMLIELRKELRRLSRRTDEILPSES